MGLGRVLQERHTLESPWQNSGEGSTVHTVLFQTSAPRPCQETEHWLQGMGVPTIYVQSWSYTIQAYLAS